MQGEVRSFVVRIWSEVVDAERRAVTWRGSVRDVLSGEHLHFEDFDALMQFIQNSAEGRASDMRHDEGEQVV